MEGEQFGGGTGSPPGCARRGSARAGAGTGTGSGARGGLRWGWGWDWSWDWDWTGTGTAAPLGGAVIPTPSAKVPSL